MELSVKKDMTHTQDQELPQVKSIPMVLDRKSMANELVKIVSEYSEQLDNDERLRFLFDLDAKLYRLQANASVAYGNGVHTKHRHIKYHDFFVERVDSSETVLDIGCGIGAVAYDIAVKRGAQVTGIDLNKNNIKISQEKFSAPNINYIHGDALTDLPQGHFNVIVLSNVLEHIEKRVEFLHGIINTCSPNRFLFRVPLFEREWRVPLKKELGVEWRLDPTHFTEYTVDSFMQEMRATSLSVKHMDIKWGEIWAEAIVEKASRD